jgi:hypothetical protein
LLGGDAAFSVTALAAFPLKSSDFEQSNNYAGGLEYIVGKLIGDDG